MRAFSRNFVKGLFAMTGTIIGAGIFGLPLAFSKVGFWPGTILYLFLTAAVTLSHVMYAAAIIRLGSKHRLAGYAGRSLGELGRVVARVTYPLHIVGANVVYIILGGEFLSALARSFDFDLPVAAWQTFFWAASVLVVLYGLKKMAVFEEYATAALLISIAAAVYLVYPQTDLNSLTRLGDFGNFALPFGVFLFSLSGLSVISEVVDITRRKPHDAYAAAAFGTLIAALFAYIFGAGLYLASRGFVLSSPSDIISLFPSAWAWVIPLLGLLAIITSYVTSAEDLRATFVRDFRLGEAAGAVVALTSPFIVFTVIRRDFLSVIGFVGAIFIGINYIIAAAISWKIAAHFRSFPKRVIAGALSVILMSVYAFGIIQKIFSKI